MPGKINTNQIEEISENEIAEAMKTLKKLQFKKGPRFTVDSKGNTKRNYKDGGLAMAIEKVKAKEMQGGGEAKSGGKAVSINTPTGRRKMAEIRKIMPGASVDEVKEFGLKAGILKMKEGGNVPKPKMRPKKDPFRADKTVILNEEFSKRVAKTNEEAMKKAKKMEDGGKVPAKFKGFSKLPESVQQKMNPDLAEKFGMGGDVKAKKSGNICRGRGIARQGTGFTIR